MIFVVVEVDVLRYDTKCPVLPCKFTYHIQADDLNQAIQYAQQRLIDNGWTIDKTKYHAEVLYDIRKEK